MLLKLKYGETVSHVPLGRLIETQVVNESKII